MANYNIDVNAELKNGKTDIQKQLDTLSKQLSVDVLAQLDVSSLKNIEKQLQQVVSNVSVNITPIVNTSTATKTGQQIGKIISDSAEKSISSVSSNSLGKVFRIDPSTSDNFKSEMSKLVKDWTNAKGQLTDIKIDTSTVYDKDAQANVENLKQATVTYKNELNEVIKKTIAWRQTGVTTNKGEEEKLYGFVEVAGRYQKALEKSSVATDTFADKQLKLKSSLSDSLNSIKSSVSDTNAAKPIKDSGNISSLQTQYKAVENAIANVGNSSKSTYAQMEADARTQLSVLKDMVTQYRNTENVATSLRTKDFSTVKDVEIEKLQTFKDKIEGSNVPIEKMRAELESLGLTLNNALNKDALVPYLNQMDVAQAKFKQLNTEIASANRNEKVQIKVDGLQSNINEFSKLSTEANNFKTTVNGAEVSVQSLISDLGNVKSQGDLSVVTEKWKSFSSAAKEAGLDIDNVFGKTNRISKSNTISSKLDAGDYKTQITTLQSSLEKWGMSADATKAKMSSLKTAYTELQNAKTVDERISAEQKFQTVLKTTQNEVAELKATMASPVKVQDAYNKIGSTLKNNSAMSKEARKSLQEYQATLKNGNVSASGLQNIENGYKNVIVQERVAGRLGNNFVDTIKRGAKSIAQWSISMYGVASVMQGLRSGIDNLKEVDNILTEISKTSDSTAAQLKEIGNASYDVASKYGVKNTAYLTGVQEMNRSGFYGKQGQAMAEQSILAQSAGDMEEEIADKWVLATNAAYKYQGQAEKINAVLNGANEITNRNSVNMTDMAEAMSTVGSNAANTGVKINELSAIIGTSVATTKKDGNEVGTAWKSIFVNLQNTSSSKILGTLDKANAKMTEMKNGIEQMRSPIDILKDLAKTYNSLDSKDPLRSEITRNLGGKHHANILGSTLDNWSSYEKMLGDYSEGGGSALEESKKSAENLTGRLNALSNSWNKFVSTIVSSDGLKTGVNLLNGLVTGVTNLTEKAHALPALIATISAGLSGFKNIGRRIQVYVSQTSSIVLNMPSMPEKVGMCEFSQLTMFYKQIVIGTCCVPVLGR